MSSSDLTYASAETIAAAVRSGDVSAAEVTTAAIQRIEKLDSAINAVVVRDFDRAIKDAHQVDEHLARGEDAPLLGVPVTVKESFNVAGLATTWGLPPFKDFIADADALAVARLRQAGAVILGKTNVPVALEDLQTYNPIYGRTNNPWDLTRTPGGSSGGSAAALAAGFGAASIGPDIAGSLRVPAHFTGVYAHKSSYGIAPARGHSAPMAPALTYNPDLTVILPMARSARDLEILLNLLTVQDPLVPSAAMQTLLPPSRHQRLADFRILIVDSHPLLPTSDETRHAIEDLAEHLTRAGTEVRRESALLPDLTENARLYARLLLASIASAYPAPRFEEPRRNAEETLSHSDIPLLARARAEGVVLSHRDWIATDTARTVERDDWRRLFKEFDVVITPASPTTAFPHDQTPDQWGRHINIDGSEYAYADQLVWAGVASAAGLPSTAVPIATSPEGLPIGVQLIGPMYEYRTPIRLAGWLEQTYRGFVAPTFN